MLKSKKKYLIAKLSQEQRERDKLQQIQQNSTRSSFHQQYDCTKMLCEQNENFVQKSNIQIWLEQQFQQFNYDLSDDSCDFKIMPFIREEKISQKIIVEIYIRPRIGIFQNIEFRPQLYLSSRDLIKRPKIYNDRRIYHPNVNLYTSEIIYTKLVYDWNPTKKIQEYLHALKYILIEPDIYIVPNNEFNKKSGIQYHFRRQKFKQLILINQPMILDQKFGKKMNQQAEQCKQFQQMQIEGTRSRQQRNFQQKNNRIASKGQSQYFNIASLYPSSFSSSFTGPKKKCYNSFNSFQQQQQVDILAKEMKKIQFNCGQFNQKQQFFNCYKNQQDNNKRNDNFYNESFETTIEQEI